jgi:hypothetical protein
VVVAVALRTFFSELKLELEFFRALPAGLDVGTSVVIVVVVVFIFVVVIVVVVVVAGAAAATYSSDSARWGSRSVTYYNFFLLSFDVDVVADDAYDFIVFRVITIAVLLEWDVISDWIFTSDIVDVVFVVTTAVLDVFLLRRLQFAPWAPWSPAWPRSWTSADFPGLRVVYISCRCSGAKFKSWPEHRGLRG